MSNFLKYVSENIPFVELNSQNYTRSKFFIHFVSNLERKTLILDLDETLIHCV